MGTFLLPLISRSSPPASHAQPRMASLSATRSSHPWPKPTVLLTKQASPLPRQANQACMVLATGKVEDQTLIRDLLAQLLELMMLLGTQEKNSVEAKMQTYLAVLEPLKT